MVPFEPKDGMAEWIKIYQLMRSGEPGAVFTFEQLNQALHREFRSNRSPMGRAIKELERVDNKSAVPIRGQGYRLVATGTEYLREGENRTRRSRRALVRASDVTSAGVRADVTTAAERGDLILASARLAQLLNAMTGKLVEHDVRIDEHEERLRRLEGGNKEE